MCTNRSTLPSGLAGQIRNVRHSAGARHQVALPLALCYVVPPYILRKLSLNGSADQASVASKTMSLDVTLRTMRVMHLMAPHPVGKDLGAAPEPEPHVRIYDAHHTEDLPGSVVRDQGASATGDTPVDEAYDGLCQVHTFYHQVFGRNSIDDQGMELDGSVHYGDRYDNAFWNGERMVFGDGDGDIFNRFTVSIDVIGHELTHGVTENEAKLTYQFQPGALNESISDVFGSLIKQFVLGQTADQADWLIGKGLFTAKVHGEALRSMKAPGTAFDDPVLGKDPQPADMKHFVKTYEDNGGVHVNSGIPNRAFYLVAANIGGHAWEKAGNIWYKTLRDPNMRPTTQFNGFAQLTLATARSTYGQNSAEAKAVADAWGQVGIKVK